jgi:hypothetical protein
MSLIRQCKIVGLVLLIALGVVRSDAALGAMNPLFAYPHLLPSPFTLPAGRLVYGTSVAFGVTDFFTIGTNILRDFYKIYNVGAKVSILDTEIFAAAATLGYETFNYSAVTGLDPDVTVSSWQPGAVTSLALHERVALFVGGNLSITKISLPDEGSGYLHGAQVESDLAWAYHPPTKKRSIVNVISAGASYDLTYKIYGVGLSHHWPGFQLGLHYFPNAKRDRFLPIIAGGGGMDL